MPENIKLKKQAFSLPVLEISTTDIATIMNDLKELVVFDDESEQTVPCIFDMSARDCDPIFVAQLVETVRQFNILPVALKTNNRAMALQAMYSGIAVLDGEQDFASHFTAELVELAASDKKNLDAGDMHDLAVAVDEAVADDLQDGNDHDETLAANTQPVQSQQFVHYGHVEDGEQVYAEGKSLIVLGDVKEGAEIIADGDIYVGGALLGKAYAANAGAINVEDVKISAYSFEPELVSLAGFYQLKEDIPKKYLGLSVTVNFESNKMRFRLA